MGCMATTNKYADLYNEAVSTGNSVVITKEGDLETIKEEIDQELNNVGYDKTIYTSPTDGFMVLVKEHGFGSALIVTDKHVYKMIVKYTSAGEGKTRIDLVNGSAESYTKDEIDSDIQKLADLIRNI